MYLLDQQKKEVLLDTARVYCQQTFLVISLQAPKLPLNSENLGSNLCAFCKGPLECVVKIHTP
jgi:hypothetical protein